MSQIGSDFFQYEIVEQVHPDPLMEDDEGDVPPINIEDTALHRANALKDTASRVWENAIHNDQPTFIENAGQLLHELVRLANAMDTTLTTIMLCHYGKMQREYPDTFKDE